MAIDLLIIQCYEIGMKVLVSINCIYVVVRNI